ncbi:MAG: ABC transporter ATP-binding protein, partial [Crenarchaeota archaeon]|nr:ABC transporter ATP-binding protein [Thermoproteota archaeon]
ILGFIKPTAGNVRVFGFDPVKHENEVRSRIGYLPEKPVYPHVKLRVLIRHVARLRNVPSRDIERIAKLTGITRYLDFNVKSLSRGYLQRLGLALALLGDPEILLLDEPTANLDPLSRKEIIELIKDLMRDLGVTVIIATHILPELQQVANYIVFINRGQVIESGDLGSIVARYRVTATFRIRADEPRKLASKLIMLEKIKAVEIIRDGLLVKATGEGVEEIKLYLEEAIGEKEASLELVSSELGELYEKLAGIN